MYKSVLRNHGLKVYVKHTICFTQKNYRDISMSFYAGISFKFVLLHTIRPRLTKNCSETEHNH